MGTERIADWSELPKKIEAAGIPIVVIDYNAQDFTRVLKDIDAVFDTVGGDVATRSFQVLKPGGRATFIASGPTAPKPTAETPTMMPIQATTTSRRRRKQNWARRASTRQA